MKTNVKKYSILFLVCIGIWSCSEVFIVDISEDEIEIVSPYDGLVTEETEHLFIWESLEFTDFYQIQIVKPTFDSAEAMILSTERIENSINISLEPGRYQWRVRGVNGNGPGNYSTRNIKILDTISDSLIVRMNTWNSIR